MAQTIIKELTQDNFNTEVLEFKGLVLVDFWAPWCGPCKMVAPVIEEIATEYMGRLKVGKVNVDDHGQVAARYGITSIPTLILFKDGKEEERMIGALPKEEIIAKIEFKL